MEEEQTKLKKYTKRQLDNMIKKTTKKISDLNKRIKGLRFCPECKKLLIRSDVNLGVFYCGNCLSFFQGDKTLSQQEICNHEFKFICKKHGENCDSYVKGMCNDLNNFKKRPENKEKCLVIEKCIICEMVKENV